MMMKQPTLHGFLGISSGDDNSSDEIYEPSEEEERKMEKSNWTRIKSYDEFNDKVEVVYDYEPDLNALLAEEVTTVEPDDMKQLVLFDPEIYRGKDDELKQEENKLSEEQLLEYGTIASTIRAGIYSKVKLMQ